MNIRSILAVIRTDLKYFTLRATAYDIAVRMMNRILFFKALRVATLSEVTFAAPLPRNFRFRRISEKELSLLTQVPEYGINPVLLDEIRWTDELEITFPSGCAYLCATFTHPDYRGRQFNSIGVGLASKEYLTRGLRPLFAYVESNNFSSLRSLHRIGWKRVGTIYVLRMWGRYLILSGRGCKNYGFRVCPVAKSISGSAVGSDIPTKSAKAR
jgi:hypothetical protein